MNDMKNDDKTMEHSAPSADISVEQKGAKSEKRRRGPVRRMLRWTAFGMAGLLGLVAMSAGGGLLFLRSDAGERWLTDTINSSLVTLPSGLSGSIASFKGPLLSEAHVEDIVLKDRKGEWLTAKGASLRIDWSALPSAFVVSEISLDGPVLLRIPELEPSAVPETEGSPSASPEEMLAQFDEFLKNWPEYLPELRIKELALRSAEVKEEASPLTFVVSARASASAGREGVNTKIAFRREDGVLPPDAPNRLASMEAALKPGSRFKFDARLSDLGFASYFLPAKLAKVPAVELSLKGYGPVKDWRMTFDGALQALGTEASEVIASTAGRLDLHPLEESPKAAAVLEVKTGPLARRMWAFAGQKDGKLSLKLEADASAGNAPSLHSKLALDLSEMQWGTPLLEALLGRELSAGTSASVKFESGSVKAVLEKLQARAAHISADASGSVALDAKGLYAAGSRADMKVSLVLNDAATLSPELSGDMRAAASVEGAFTALKTTLALTGSRLDLPSVKLNEVDMRLDIPSADIARILDALSGNAAHQKDRSLMEGALTASLEADGYPVSMNTDWRVRGAGRTGLDLALEKLDLRAGGNTVQGHLAAKHSITSPAPAKGSVAAMLGAPLPSLDGRFSIDVSDWAMLGELAGIAVSGAPLHAELTLENGGKQSLRADAGLPSLRLDTTGTPLELSGISIELDSSDLWGKPFSTLIAGFNELKTGKITQNETVLKAKGGLSSLDIELSSKGGLESSVQAQWRPGALEVRELEAKLHPENLGLTKGPSAGLSLVSPLNVTYSGESVTVPSAVIDILPAGRITAEGHFSPDRLTSSFSLSGLALNDYRHFSPAIPSGMVDMQADFSGSTRAPSGKFKLNLKDIRLQGSSFKPMDAELVGSLDKNGRRRMLETSLDLPEKTLKALELERFKLKASVPFTSPASGVSMPDMDAPFNAELSLGGQLAGLWRLVPTSNIRVSGIADLNGKIEGSLSKPVVTAHLALDNGRFLDILNGVGLRRIQLKVDAEQFDIMNRKAKERVMFSLSGKAGSKGILELGGWLDPSTMALDIDGTMKDLAPLRRQDAKVMLSGTLGVEGTVTSPQVKADITVDKGQIELAKLPSASIPELEIWEPEQEKKDEKPAVPGHLDVTVRIPNQFFVRGYGLDCEWSGLLRIDSPLDRPAVSGRLKAVRGSLDILGKNFKLAEGEVRFDGGWPVSPLLDIDMEYVASDLTANILVSGTASRPKLTLTSQPAFAQDEIISQIMFGQSSGSLSHVQALQLASGVATLTGFGGADVMGMGRKLLGVDVFRVNSDNDSEDSDVSTTSLEVGTYVRDNIYVGMEQGVGKDADTGAVVEIELLPSLEVQARAGSKDTEVGLEWKKSY